MIVNNLVRPTSVILQQVATSTSDMTNRNVSYVFPCYDLSPQRSVSINTKPISINTSTTSK